MTGKQSDRSPITIEINSKPGGAFKSIKNLRWDDIPPFAVLTGLNGSGKSHLLEFLAYKLSKTPHPENYDLNSISVTVVGDNFYADEIAYVPNSGVFSSNVSVNIAKIAEVKKNLYDELRQSRQRETLELGAKRKRVERMIGVEKISKISQAEFIKRLPDDYAFMLEHRDVLSGLGHVFLGYRLRFLQELERGELRSEIEEKLGPAPWHVLNEALRVAEFPYQVSSPEGSAIVDTYNLTLTDMSSGMSIKPQHLSSGEKTILQLILWLYNSQYHNSFPSLLLLDEPDAHLHPSMTQQFINVVNEVLVEKYKVRVILTTHSPSTVALAPTGTIFEMSRAEPRIRKSHSKSNTIGLLTAGIVTVSEGTRYALVEGDADVMFYEAVRDILSDFGPSRDNLALSPSPSIVFLPVSSGEGKSKVGGGKDAVVRWTKKFDSPPLDQMFRGIIDLDTGNEESEHIYVIGRHSIENYLLDPILIYGLLLEENIAPRVEGVEISSGDEHQLRLLKHSELQKIVSHVEAAVEPRIPDIQSTDGSPRQVQFTNGASLFYPEWMLSYRGHDLFPIYQELFGGPRVTNPMRLLKVLRRVRLIPIELAHLLSRLQN